MPQLKIFSEGVDDTLVRLRLNDDEDGDITVLAVDSDGDEICRLVCFKKNGKISLCTGVSDNLGFKLDSDQSIKTEKE